MITEDTYLELIRVVLDRCERIQDTLTEVQIECTRLLEENRSLRIRASQSSMAGVVDDVYEFIQAFGQGSLNKPGYPGSKVAELRLNLICEEFAELKGALMAGDLVETADGIADLIYVTVGTAIAYGIPLEKVWSAVHASNMAKTTGGKDERGKVMKPAGWQPPDIKRILEEASK